MIRAYFIAWYNTTGHEWITITEPFALLPDATKAAQTAGANLKRKTRIICKLVPKHFLQVQ